MNETRGDYAGFVIWFIYEPAAGATAVTFFNLWFFEKEYTHFHLFKIGFLGVQESDIV